MNEAPGGHAGLVPGIHVSLDCGRGFHRGFLVQAMLALATFKAL